MVDASIEDIDTFETNEDVAILGSASCGVETNIKTVIQSENSSNTVKGKASVDIDLELPAKIASPLCLLTSLFRAQGQKSYYLCFPTTHLLYE
jgi:hypothetical protein